MSDDELMAEFQRTGAPELLGELYKRHNDRAVRIVRKIAVARYKPLAEEIAQEAWTNLAKSRATFKPGQEFMPWFQKLLGTTTFRFIKRESRYHHEVDDRPERERPSHQADTEELMRVLSPHQRQIVTDVYLNGRTIVDVAAEHGLGKSRMHEKLQESLEEMRSRA